MNFSIKHIASILLFLILQIVWFNHILLFGKYSPIIFIFPLLLLPIQKKESLSIFLAFFMGLIIDVSLNTGGVFAATGLFVVYFRKIYFLFVKNQSQDIENIIPSELSFTIRFFYYTTFILFSQLLIYFLESLNFSLILFKLPTLLINSLITLLIFFFIDIIFINSKESN